MRAWERSISVQMEIKEKFFVHCGPHQIFFEFGGSKALLLMSEMTRKTMPPAMTASYEVNLLHLLFSLRYTWKFFIT